MVRRVAAVVVTLIALLSAVRLVAPQDPAGVRPQLTFLRARLDKGAPDDAQKLFPEGYFFLVFRSLFVMRPLGLGPGVRRYPPGAGGPFLAALMLVALLSWLGALRSPRRTKHVFRR
ncbi:hypothetical protein [Winogradskya consettensis]|nr:hypothetical protein [Actinoplanes consettensis]